MFSLEKLPQLIIPVSTGYIVECFLKAVGNWQEQNAKQNSTNNYSILKNSFEILEKAGNIDNQAFIEEYDQNTTSNEAIFEKINKIVFQEQNKNEYIFPKIIKEEIDKKEEEKKLRLLNMQKSKSEAEAAELTRLKIEEELVAKNIVKIFNFETYDKKREVRPFYGWEKYTEAKATAITSQINVDKAIKENTILYGPPGCGKTSYVENVTKAIAKKLNKNVVFYNIKNADLKTKTQNSATAHVDQLFEQVYEKAKNETVVLFFDEFDGISTKREEIHDEKKEDKIDHQNNDLTALLLQKIEGAAGKEKILIFAATNHIENMDSALIRTGRFEHRIHIGKPNFEMRTEIIKNIFKEEAKEEEVMLLLHLTSNQTTVDVAKTVDQYLAFKNDQIIKKNGSAESSAIVSFTKKTIEAQYKREGKKEPLSEEQVAKWIERNKRNIKILIDDEAKNNEIVSIEAINDQERLPSLKRIIENVIRAEEINESKEERFIRVLTEGLKPLGKIEQQLKNLEDKKYGQLEILNKNLDAITRSLEKTEGLKPLEEEKQLKKLVEILNKNKEEEINRLDVIAKSLEKIVDEKTMKEYLHQTAKAFAAINIQSQAELSFNYRKNIILEYFKQFEKEFDRLKKEDEPVAKNTLLYLLLLFTDKFSYAELHLVLQDLFINKFYVPRQAEVDRALDEKIFLTNKNNRIALHRSVIQESGSLQATMTERKAFEERMRCELSSFKEVLEIFQTYAPRIVLRERIFLEEHNTYAKNTKTIFDMLMGLTTKKIEYLINQENKEKLDEKLDEKFENFISNFTLKSIDPDERNKTRKTNLNAGTPNSYIRFNNIKDIIDVLTVIGVSEEDLKSVRNPSD